MKKSTVYILIVLVAIIVASTTSFLFLNNKIVKRQTFVTEIHVWEQRVAGFDVDTRGLIFGAVGDGMGGQRKIIISGVEEDSFVRITKSGKMAPWISHEEDFFLEKGEEKELEFNLLVPAGTPIGNYTGKVTLTLFRPE